MKDNRQSRRQRRELQRSRISRLNDILLKNPYYNTLIPKINCFSYLYMPQNHLNKYKSYQLSSTLQDILRSSKQVIHKQLEMSVARNVRVALKSRPILQREKNVISNIIVAINSRLKIQMQRLRLLGIAKIINKPKFKSIRQKCSNPLYVLHLYREIRKCRMNDLLQQLLTPALSFIKKRLQSIKDQDGRELQNSKLFAFSRLIYELKENANPQIVHIMAIVGSGIFSHRKGRFTKKRKQQVRRCLSYNEGQIPSNIS